MSIAALLAYLYKSRPLSSASFLLFSGCTQSRSAEATTLRYGEATVSSLPRGNVNFPDSDTKSSDKESSCNKHRECCHAAIMSFGRSQRAQRASVMGPAAAMPSRVNDDIYKESEVPPRRAGKEWLPYRGEPGLIIAIDLGESAQWDMDMAFPHMFYQRHDIQRRFLLHSDARQEAQHL